MSVDICLFVVFQTYVVTGKSTRHDVKTVFDWIGRNDISRYPILVRPLGGGGGADERASSFGTHSSRNDFNEIDRYVRCM